MAFTARNVLSLNQKARGQSSNEEISSNYTMAIQFVDASLVASGTLNGDYCSVHSNILCIRYNPILLKAWKLCRPGTRPTSWWFPQRNHEVPATTVLAKRLQIIEFIVTHNLDGNIHMWVGRAKQLWTFLPYGNQTYTITPTPWLHLRLDYIQTACFKIKHIRLTTNGTQYLALWSCNIFTWYIGMQTVVDGRVLPIKCWSSPCQQGLQLMFKIQGSFACDVVKALGSNDPLHILTKCSTKWLCQHALHI